MPQAEKPDTECLRIGSWRCLVAQKITNKPVQKGLVARPSTLLFDCRSGCSSFVMMMQSADHGSGYNPASLRQLHRTWHWTVLFPCQVCPTSMIIVQEF